MRYLRTLARGVGLCALLLVPAGTSAHAFGQKYTLPLPLSFYVVGAGAALIASFVILGLFSNPGKHQRYEKTIALSPRLSHLAYGVSKLFGVLVLVGALIAAFAGRSDVTKNPSLFLFWVGLLLLVTYVSALVSGVWERLDPFRTITNVVLGKNYRPLLDSFPTWLRYVPALLFYFWLLWFELLSFGAGALPYNIGFTLIGYIILTICGVGVFGYVAWFRYGDFFSVFFGVVERFAPLRIQKERVVVMPPGENLLEEYARTPTILIFILLMLSSTAFDGIHETQIWIDAMSRIGFLLRYYEIVSIVLLALSPLLFFGLYSIAIYGMCLITSKLSSYSSMLMRFAFSLIPIVVAYNFAHYFSLALSEGQRFVPMLSDPLGRGWDIFGTATYVYNPALISAGTVWYVQVIVILIGHIVATYVAHRIALAEFSSRTHIILGQIPMLLLMVFYTGFGLWILSLPFGA